MNDDSVPAHDVSREHDRRYSQRRKLKIATKPTHTDGIDHTTKHTLMDLIIIGHNISCSYKEESQNKPLTPSILRLMVRKVLPKKTSSFLHFWIAVVLATSIISSNMRVVNSFVTSATSKAMKHRAKNVISSAPKSKHPKLSIPRGGHQPSNSFSSSSSTTSTSLKATSSKTSTVAARDALSEMDKGEFKRTESIWRSWISSGTYLRHL